MAEFSSHSMAVTITMRVRERLADTIVAVFLETDFCIFHPEFVIGSLFRSDAIKLSYRLDVPLHTLNPGDVDPEPSPDSVPHR